MSNSDDGGVRTTLTEAVRTELGALGLFGTEAGARALADARAVDTMCADPSAAGLLGHALRELDCNLRALQLQAPIAALMGPARDAIGARCQVASTVAREAHSRWGSR